MKEYAKGRHILITKDNFNNIHIFLNFTDKLILAYINENMVISSFMQFKSPSA
jgi:hypothetical protein